MKVQRAVETQEGPGFIVDRVITPRAPLDPFLLLDHFGPKSLPKGERFPAGPHPHRGFETVTYSLSGSIEHHDAWGNYGVLGPGDVEWMRAGSGLVHGLEGKLKSDGLPIEGLQLWVNLPAKDKMSSPGIAFTRKGDTPIVRLPGGRVHVIAGTFQDAESQAGTLWPIRYLHVELEDGSVDLNVEPDESAFVYVLRGAITVNGQLVQERHRAELANRFTARGTNAAFVFLSAKPIGEPIEAYGPFVMNEHDEIVQAVRDFQAGKMGDPMASLPGTKASDSQMQAANT
ncbi:MAG: pirin family protein [Thermoplasmatota archaeon]